MGAIIGEYLAIVKNCIIVFLGQWTLDSRYGYGVFIIITLALIITVNLFKGILNIFKKGI